LKPKENPGTISKKKRRKNKREGKKKPRKIKWDLSPSVVRLPSKKVQKMIKKRTKN